MGSHNDSPIWMGHHSWFSLFYGTGCQMEANDGYARCRIEGHMEGHNGYLGWYVGGMLRWRWVPVWLFRIPYNTDNKDDAMWLVIIGNHNKIPYV